MSHLELVFFGKCSWKSFVSGMTSSLNFLTLNSSSFWSISWWRFLLLESRVGVNRTRHDIYVDNGRICSIELHFTQWLSACSKSSASPTLLHNLDSSLQFSFFMENLFRWIVGAAPVFNLCFPFSSIAMTLGWKWLMRVLTLQSSASLKIRYGYPRFTANI